MTGPFDAETVAVRPSLHFALVGDDGVDLVLRGPDTVVEMHRLTVRNLDRLRRWEAWAHGELTEEGTRAYTQMVLRDWAEGRSVPCAISVDGALVGSIGASLDAYSGVAQLGYWVDLDYEGRGVVTGAARAMLSYLFSVREVERVEIRCAVDNVRSRAVAERLGFTQEGVLRSAMPVGGVRQDLVLYGRIAAD